MQAMIVKEFRELVRDLDAPRCPECPGRAPGTQAEPQTAVLERPDGASFVASVQGRRQPASRLGLLRAAARHPWSTAAVSARIRVQGIRLYLRGLPIAPRPRHQPQEGVQ